MIPAGPDIPWFGNQFHLRENRVLMNDVKKGAQFVDIMQFSRERRREIEAEPVDVHFQNPIPQAIHDQLQDSGRLHVQGVAAAGVVLVVPR